MNNWALVVLESQHKLNVVRGLTQVLRKHLGAYEVEKRLDWDILNATVVRGKSEGELASVEGHRECVVDVAVRVNDFLEFKSNWLMLGAHILEGLEAADGASVVVGRVEGGLAVHE